MIDYKILADSTEYYQALGFTRIEAPWTVSEATSEITRPQQSIDYMLMHNRKVLVGSGEQSFLYLMTKGYLVPGKYQTVTPCFRDEQFDLMHSKYFMKNELIITDDVSRESLSDVIHKSLGFFAKYIPIQYLTIAEYSDTTDIECVIGYTNYELGSYGIRHESHLEWVFATGCAEPRLSTVIKMYNKWATTREK